MRAIRPALALALAAVTASTAFAFAADAPATTPTSRTLFLAQQGCGSTVEPGRLEPKPQDDSGDGCGFIAGLPLAEIDNNTGDTFGFADGIDYTTTKSFVPALLDGAKKITGQVAAGAHITLPVVGGTSATGGVGTVTWDISLKGTTVSGKAVDFGSTTVNAPATPGQAEVTAPFQLSVPATATEPIKQLVIHVLLRGQNVGMTGTNLKGHEYLVLPVKAPAPAPKPTTKKKTKKK